MSPHSGVTAVLARSTLWFLAFAAILTARLPDPAAGAELSARVAAATAPEPAHATVRLLLLALLLLGITVHLGRGRAAWR